jgi:cobalamin biosynthesis protein CobD/CbiB
MSTRSENILNVGFVDGEVVELEFFSMLWHVSCELHGIVGIASYRVNARASRMVGYVRQRPPQPARTG